MTESVVSPSARPSNVFSSTEYNNVAIVAPDNPLEDPLPSLTPPPAPALSPRTQSHPRKITDTGIRQRYQTRAQTHKEDQEREETDTTATTRKREIEDTNGYPADKTPITTDRQDLHISSSDSSSPSSITASAVSTPVLLSASLSAAPAAVWTPPAEIFPSVPLHRKLQPSILSAEAPPVNFRGLYNLAGITLFALTARLVIENITKYGLLFKLNVLHAMTEDWDKTYPCLLIAFFLCCAAPTVAYLLEVLTVAKVLTNQQVACLHTLHITIVFLIPQILIVWTNASYLSGLVLELVILVMTMKLISLAHVSHDLRHKQLSKQAADDHPVLYHPSLLHVFYFICAPTLIYQLSYPRSPHIRPVFLVRRLIELMFCLSLQLLLIEQYIYPTVVNAMASLNSMNYIMILERILKISVPNGCVWLLMFYGIFHSWLNIIGELLCFGDRLFYKDWWNCQSLDVYWRNWNMPVHHWVTRHVYAPVLRAGYSNVTAQMIAFLLSAIMHELLVAIPLRSLKLYAFVGMLIQMPLIYMSRWLVQKMGQPVWGNCVFWLTFLVFGQPLLILLYSHAILGKQEVQSAAESSLLRTQSIYNGTQS